MRKRLTPARLIAPKAVERRDRSTCPERRGSDWSSGGCRGDATEVAGARFEGSSSRVRKPVNPRQKCGRLILRDWPFDFARYSKAVLTGMEWMGIVIDDEANSANAQIISAKSSPAAVFVIPTDEERMMARHSLEVLSAAGLAPAAA